MYMAEMALKGAILPFAEELAVAHCNFGLRGEDSCGDEDFVRDWCSGHKVRCFVKRFDTIDFAQRRGISIEMAARTLRYSWFADICRNNGYDALAVAHNADDNAETLLLNLTRGTGLRGICGMSEDCISAEGLRILRPVLDKSRSSIREWMKAEGLSWREDRTNSEDAYRRNFIRNRIMPLLESLNPSVLRTLGDDMSHFSQAEAIVDEWYGQAVKGWNLSEGVPFEAVKNLPHKEYALHRLLEPYGFISSQTEKIAALIVSGRTLGGKSFESAGYRLEFSAGKMKLWPLAGGIARADEEEVRIPGPGEYGFGGRKLRIEVIGREAVKELKQAPGTLIADAESVRFPLTLRRWREGDRMHPFGMRGSKKLSDIFTDLKWDSRRKAGAIVATSAGGELAFLDTAIIENGLRVTSKTVYVLRISEII